MKLKHNSAIALILTVGILAILALITVGFSAFTRLELQATENQTNLLKASFIAQAGIAKAIEDIKYDANYGAMNDPYDSAADPWYYPGNASYDGSTVDLDSADNPSYGNDINYAGGSYRLKVIDCGGLININCDLPNSDAQNDLENILDQLGLTATQAQNLVAYRQTLPGQVFTSKEEIKLVSGIGQSSYDLVKDCITLWGDEDDGIIDLDKTAASPVSGHSRKSFVNVNTAPIEVLKAVFRLMMNSNTQADNFADAIKARRDTNPFDGSGPTEGVNNFLDARGEFERYLEYAQSVGIISAANRDAVMAQSDPNSYSLANTNSTDSAIIGFDANGYYEIEAIGAYRGAKKRIKQVVSVFRKINQTTKNEFSVNASLPVTRRISWKDTCPVDFTVLKQFQYNDDTGDSPNPDDYIADSLKLGFWDNFQEDYDPTAPDPDGSGNKGSWTAIEETFTINDGDNGLLETWATGGVVFDIDYFPQIQLDKDVCIVDDFAMIVHGIDETSNSKYPGFRPDLPWPAVPREWWFWAPAPDATNCPDIGTYLKDADGNLVKDTNGNDILIDVLYVSNHTKSFFIHEQYLNTLHIKFGGILLSNGLEWMSAIFCNNIQDKDLFFNNISDKVPVYQNWVNYDGSGYIYFTPSPPLGPGWEEWFQTCMKSYDVLKTGNVMVSCNQWYWGGHPADLGTEFFPITGGGYYAEKTIHLKGLGRWNTRGDVYSSNLLSTSFNTSEQVMVYQDRYFQIAGMGNFPDLDYFRVVPGQGVYTSQMFNPTATMGAGRFIEWGTIQAHVSLPGTADSSREPVYLVTSDSAILTVPDPADIPAPYILPSGGAIGTTAIQSICYQTYLFSDFGETDINNTDFEQAPVVEDVTMTYLPKTQIVYYNAM